MNINKTKMKAIIEFQLPDEQVEFESASNGSKAVASLHDFDQWLREQQKYQNKESIEIDQLRTKLRNTMEENGLYFEMIMFS